MLEITGGVHNRKAAWSEDNPDARWRCYDFARRRSVRLRRDAGMARGAAPSTSCRRGCRRDAEFGGQDADPPVFH